MHIDISENTANVSHVTKEVQQRWGQGYVIVTSDGLELEDCEGTQGLLSPHPSIPDSTKSFSIIF